MKRITYTIDEPDPENGAILYADTDRGTFRICPELYPDGGHMKWTGNAEVQFREIDSEEFDTIASLPGLLKENATEFADGALQEATYP